MEKPDFDHYKHSAPEYTEQILWHRIVAVALFGLAVLILLVWLGYWLLAKPSTPAPAVNIPTGLAQADNVSGDSVARTGVEGNSEESPIPTPMLTADESATPDSKSMEAPSVAAAEPPQPEEETAQSKSVPESGQPVLSQSKTGQPDLALAQAASDPDPQADVPSASQPESNPINEAEFEVTTRIMDGDVSRAELASSMEQLEPDEAVENTSNLTDPFIKLYFFTDLKDRAGDRLTYTWVRNGETAATVRIAVGSDRWRSHASKNISQNMRGEWEVIVTDKVGDTLAKSHFILPDVAALSQ